MRKLLLACALVLVAGAATPASADPLLLTVRGVNDPSLSADILLTYNPQLGQLSLSITNASANHDPRLTGFAFNLPGAITGISSFSSTHSGWSYDYDRNDINTPGQFGFFDAAGLTGSNINGGSSNLGIPIGSTFLFNFRFRGHNLGSLNEQSFTNLLSYDPAGGPNENEQAFIARFQRVGSSRTGSDVAIPTTVQRVPEPSVLLLSGMGFLGLGAHLRRRLRPKT
jgi:PEP-CTERM motif